MKSNDIFTHIGLHTLSGVIGIAAGGIIQANQPIDIDHKIRYSELINWGITLFIGFWVGYRLKNEYENNKTIKSMLIEDIKAIISETQKSNTIFKEIRPKIVNNEFSDDQLSSIVSQMTYLDQRITIFCKSLEDNYKTDHQNIQQKLTEKYLDLNSAATDPPDNIDNNYFDSLSRRASALEAELRSTISKVVGKM